jgi:hypothetical protein
MLRTTLRQLAKGWGTSPRRPSRVSTHRPTLEALEDRMVLSTAHLFPNGVLSISASPGTISPPPLLFFHVRNILLEADAKAPSRLDVFDNGALLGQFPIAKIKAVDVTVAGLDAITVDDSNGPPLAPLTPVSLHGTGFLNSLNVTGNKAINADETFTPGSATQKGTLESGAVAYDFTSAIATVTDTVPNPSPSNTLFVQTRSPSVFFGSQFLLKERFSGLATGGGGGNTLIFAGKAEVVLEVESDNAIVTLDATVADPALKGLDVQLFGKNDTVNIVATPSTMSTEVQTIGTSDRVNVRGNSGFVIVLGNKSATVVLGSNDIAFKSVTSGINGNVSVFDTGVLEIEDGANVTTPEQVKVSESTVSGTGLFGNSGVVVHYGDTPLAIFTGRMPNTYTVAPTLPGARFSNFIAIEDLFSPAGLTVVVDVDHGSGLSLSLFKFLNPANGHLKIVAPPGAIFSPPFATVPNGFEQVNFPPFGLVSRVGYRGFLDVHLI